MQAPALRFLDDMAALGRRVEYARQLGRYKQRLEFNAQSI